MPAVEPTVQFQLTRAAFSEGARERAQRRFDRDTTRSGDAWYRPSMRSIRGEGEVSRTTAARSQVLETLRQERRDP